MSQIAELTRVKARIKALTEKTVSNGCTEAEAMAAAEMVGRLLERYALTMEEIDVREEQCRQVEVPIGGQRRRPIDACVPGIARFCDCKVWISRDGATPSYVFFGFEVDTALASYLFVVIDRAIHTELAVFRAAHPWLNGITLRRASISFQQGMAVRVADRLQEMHARREADVAEQRSSGTALMLVKHQVVEDAFRTSGTRLASAGRLGRMRLNGALARPGGRRSGQPSPASRRERTSAARLMGTRDHQRSKVYAWEERIVAPCAPDRVAFSAAQGMVDAIWAELGLRFPPKIESLPRQTRTTAADADRLTIRLPATFPSWHLLHELAHALACTHDGQSEGHGPIFTGLYVQLLARYLRFDVAWLRESLHNAGIAAARDARPVFLDTEAGSNRNMHGVEEEVRRGELDGPILIAALYADGDQQK